MKGRKCSDYCRCKCRSSLRPPQEDIFIGADRLRTGWLSRYSRGQPAVSLVARRRNISPREWSADAPAESGSTSVSCSDTVKVTDARVMNSCAHSVPSITPSTRLSRPSDVAMLTTMYIPILTTRPCAERHAKTCYHMSRSAIASISSAKSSAGGDN
jgi:hypothetical protein